jgi:hypothetical protein
LHWCLSSGLPGEQDCRSPAEVRLSAIPTAAGRDREVRSSAFGGSGTSCCCSIAHGSAGLREVASLARVCSR